MGSASPILSRKNSLNHSDVRASPIDSAFSRQDTSDFDCFDIMPLRWRANDVGLSTNDEAPTPVSSVHRHSVASKIVKIAADSLSERPLENSGDVRDKKELQARIQKQLGQVLRVDIIKNVEAQMNQDAVEIRERIGEAPGERGSTVFFSLDNHVVGDKEVNKAVPESEGEFGKREILEKIIIFDECLFGDAEAQKESCAEGGIEDGIKRAEEQVPAKFQEGSASMNGEVQSEALRRIRRIQRLIDIQDEFIKKLSPETDEDSHVAEGNEITVTGEKRCKKDVIQEMQDILGDMQREEEDLEVFHIKIEGVLNRLLDQRNEDDEIEKEYEEALLLSGDEDVIEGLSVEDEQLMEKLLSEGDEKFSDKVKPEKSEILVEADGKKDDVVIRCPDNQEERKEEKIVVERLDNQGTDDEIENLPTDKIVIQVRELAGKLSEGNDQPQNEDREMTAESIEKEKEKLKRARKKLLDRLLQEKLIKEELEAEGHQPEEEKLELLPEEEDALLGVDTEDEEVEEHLKELSAVIDEMELQEMEGEDLVEEKSPEKRKVELIQEKEAIEEGTGTVVDVERILITVSTKTKEVTDERETSGIDKTPLFTRRYRQNQVLGAIETTVLSDTPKSPVCDASLPGNTSPVHNAPLSDDVSLLVHESVPEETLSLGDAPVSEKTPFLSNAPCSSTNTPLSNTLLSGDKPRLSVSLRLGEPPCRSPESLNQNPSYGNGVEGYDSEGAHSNDERVPHQFGYDLAHPQASWAAPESNGAPSQSVLNGYDGGSAQSETGLAHGEYAVEWTDDQSNSQLWQEPAPLDVDLLSQIRLETSSSLQSFAEDETVEQLGGNFFTDPQPTYKRENDIMKPDELIDNNDKGWDVLRNLRTDFERCTALRHRWGNPALPNPRIDLTTHNFRKQRLAVIVKETQPSRKRPASISNDGPPRKRICVNDLLDERIAHLQREGEDETQKLKAKLGCALNNINTEKVNKISDLTAAYGPHFLHNYFVEVEKRCHLESDRLKYKYDQQFREVWRKKSAAINQFQNAKHEMESFYKFYGTDDVHLTPEEVDAFAEQEHMFTMYDKLYSG